MTLGLLEAIILIGLFWATIYGLSLILPLNKYGLQVKPLYFVYKTKRFNIALNGTTKRFKRFWLVVWNIGVASSMGLMSYSLYILISNLVKFFQVPEKAGPMVLLLPGITIGLQSLPFFLIALAIVMITHEAAHGIASRLENIEIQSAGILMVFLLFGAFVEPDEDQLNRARLASKARVYGAGSLVNLLTAVLIIIILEIVRWDLLPMQIAYYLFYQLFWIGLLSLNVAIFNMLPLYPFDGDGFLITLVEALKKGSGSKVRAMMSAISLLVLVANLTLTFFRFGPYLL